ncbi:DUF7535 family protein [Halorientalis salina]|uniref:DUF7535 family protein n=1 Tax=Halorientalis salina TaxID=2932266 RepID=UPI0010ABAE87|nr:hypothetical protein [Halorientalis salina]
MSESEGTGDEPPHQELQTVTRSYLGQPNMAMDVVGWVIFLLLLVVILPLLPFFVLFWLISKTFEFLRRQTG